MRDIIISLSFSVIQGTNPALEWFIIDQVENRDISLSLLTRSQHVAERSLGGRTHESVCQMLTREES